MVTAVEVVTATVVTVKLALLAPAATVTLAGVVEDALLSDSVTSAPPVGAGPFRVTVPTDELPPAAVGGFITNVASAVGLTVSTAVCVEPL